MKKKGEIKTIKINQQELESLLYFLKFNKPFRYLDQKIFGKDIYKSYGGIYSQKKIRDYGLSSKDKGKLFIYSEQQVKIIIKKYLSEREIPLVDIIEMIKAKSIIENYKNSYLIARDVEQAKDILGPIARNLIQTLFRKTKIEIGKCEFDVCPEVKLQTAHIDIDRPKFLKDAIRKIGKNEGRYNIFKILEVFLNDHKKKGCVRFLCKEHHDELDSYKKKHKSKKSKEKIKEFKSKLIN